MSDTSEAKSMSGPGTIEPRRATYLPFARPSITDADVDAVVEVLRSGWITTGPRGARFEEAFADAVGAAGAVAFSSGTAGMHLLLHAMDIGPGDEVITPSMTWVSTVNLIALRGATPVFADVDRDTLLVAPEEIERRCSKRTKLIIPVHFAGAPVDLDPIRALAATRGIPVIEDSAHAAGTEYRGRSVGAEGTSVFSFHPIKNMTTAEGGMVCSDDAKLLDRLRGLRFHGLGVDAFDRASQGRKPQAEVLEPGFKYNLPDLCAVLGLSQLERLHAMNERRRALATRYRERLAGLDAIRPLRDPTYDFRHSWHLFIVRLDVDAVGMSRDAFLEALGALNIGAGIHFRAVHLQLYYARQGHRRGELPDTEWNSDRLLSIPLFPDMTDQDVDDVVDAMQRVITGA